MTPASSTENSSGPRNPAKSWAVGLLFIPVIVVAVLLGIRSQVHPNRVQSAALPPSAADGRVHAVAPSGELESESWDGVMRWNPYPGAASYVVRMYIRPEEPLWTQTATGDGTTVQTEVLPFRLMRHIASNATVGYTVTARDAAGNTIAESGPRSFYLRLAGARAY